MTEDNAQPAAAQAGQGPQRLTPEREAQIRERYALSLNGDVLAIRDLLDELDATRADLQQARAEKERLREALSFYANPGSYGVMGEIMIGPTSTTLDRGDRARAILAADQPAAAGAELLAAADALAGILSVLVEKPLDGPSRRHYVDSWEPGLEALAAYRRARAGRSLGEGPGREG